MSRAQYKRILLSKLTPKVREHVVDLVDEEGCTYDSLKRKLLEKVGLSRRDLEIKLFNDLEEDTKSMDREARYKHVKALVDRVCMMVKDKEELALFMAKGLFRVGLPLTEQGLIDGRTHRGQHHIHTSGPSHFPVTSISKGPTYLANQVSNSC